MRTLILVLLYQSVFGVFSAFAREPSEVWKIQLAMLERQGGTAEVSPFGDAVRFWEKVYGEWTGKEGVIHDAKDLRRIYRRVKTSERERARLEVREQLLKLHRLEKLLDQTPPSEWDRQLWGPSLTASDREVYSLFSEKTPGRFLAASHYRRLRFQQGQLENFQSGIQEGGAYFEEMERIFIEHRIPWEITRLPLVESSFNLKARSKVGASGVWQFMRATGREFLWIDDEIDERNDPLRASHAAAELLTINFEELGNWPLAVTAYNHGRASLRRISSKYATSDLNDLIVRVRERHFGFASRNFFACLVAAVRIEQRSTIARKKPQPFFQVEMPGAISLEELARWMKWAPRELRALNPALLGSGKRVRIPKGYLLNGPRKTSQSPESAVREFQMKFQKIPSVFRRASL